jgi:hypothetical protein
MVSPFIIIIISRGAGHSINAIPIIGNASMEKDMKESKINGHRVIPMFSYRARGVRSCSRQSGSFQTDAAPSEL